jgi:hypothetical protein
MVLRIVSHTLWSYSKTTHHTNTQLPTLRCLVGEVVPLRPKREAKRLEDSDAIYMWSCGKCNSETFFLVQGVGDPCGSPVCTKCRTPVNAFLVEDE